MKLQLVLADRCPTCVQTEQVWRRVCDENRQDLEVLFTDTAHGRHLVDSFALQMFPALLADGRVCAVGAPSEGTARDTLLRLLDRWPEARA